MRGMRNSMEQIRRRMGRKAGACLALGAVLLAAAGGPTVKADENSSLTLYMSEEQEHYIYAKALEEFRQTWPEVELNVITYSMDEMMADPVRMKTELMAGGGPDLLLFNSWGTDDVYKLLAAGVFAPLDAFMTPENGWEEASYVMPVVEGGRFDGTQYVIPLNYDLRLGIASREGLEEIGFDLGACTDTVSVLKEIAALYDADYSDRILADGAQLMSFPQHLGDSFLNYEDGEIGVDQAVLQEACTAYCRMYEEELDNIFGEFRYYGYGKDILERRAYVAVPIAMEGYLSAAAAIAAQDTPVILPFCTSGGKLLAEVRLYAGIRANSENKQNAWNMLRLFLQEEMQSTLASYTSYIPVQRAALEAAIEENLSEVMEGGREMLEIGEPGAEFLEEYKKMLTEPDGSIFLSDLTAQKFFSAMEPFYAGDADYEECLAEFEEYVKIYLTE